MKTHFKKLQNPNFLGSWDLVDASGKYKELTATITKVDKEFVHDGQGGKEEMPVIHLKGLKPMVSNATNLKAIAKVTGSKFIEDWIGKAIIIRVQQVKAFGEMHDALRVATVAPKLSELDQLNATIRELLEAYQGSDKEAIRTQCKEAHVSGQYNVEFAKSIIAKLNGK